jgi:2-phosphosulfolactate phosphatase
MLNVHLLPSLTTPADLAGGLVVVIDVLRATTTICHALAAGGVVIPCLEVDEARGVAGDYPPGQAVLGGERKGLRIEGFDLGNSPSEYTPATVGGRTVVFTTTNGTRALRQCAAASRVILGAFANLSAVCREVAGVLTSGGAAHLLCAGTRGEITSEDALFAGAVAHRMTAETDQVAPSSVSAKESRVEAPIPVTPVVGGARRAYASTLAALNDQAYLAALAWRELAGERETISPSELADQLAWRSQGGRNLMSLGLSADILEAATIDRFDFVPELRIGPWEIVRG